MPLLSVSEYCAIARRTFHCPVAARRRSAPSVSFVVHCRGDSARLAALLPSLRRAYPSAPVAVISDGDSDVTIEGAAREHGARFVAGERLKVPGFAPRFIERFLTIFRELGADAGIRLDPDAEIHRPFRYVPDADFFGTMLGTRRAARHLQGGCVGFSLRAIETILDSGILRSEKYSLLTEWCRDPMLARNIARYEASRAQANIDFMMFAMAGELALRSADWHEVLSLWRWCPPVARRFFAATHPAPAEGSSVRA